MKPVDTVHASDWKDGFLFVGNHLALDFPEHSSDPERRTHGTTPRFQLAIALGSGSRVA